MRNITAGVVTPEDIKQYFTGGSWRTSDRDGTFIGWSDTAQVELKIQEPKFRLRIESTEDPSDSGDFVTAKPMKELAAFLGQDIPGGEHFEKMSSQTPAAAASSLSVLASLVEREVIGPITLSRILRRLSVSQRTARGQIDHEADYISGLRKEMESKGWVVEQEDDDRGLPLLKVDISGIYEASISVEELSWSYKFEVIDAPDTVRKGVTGDPIAEYRKYYRDPEIAEAAKDVKAVRSKKSEDVKDDATVAPSRKKPEDSGDAETGRPAA